MKAAKVATGKSKQFQARNKGPLVITQVLPFDTYRVQSLAANDQSKLGTTAHVSQLKIWRGFESNNSGASECESDCELYRETDESTKTNKARQSTEIVANNDENENVVSKNETQSASSTDLSRSFRIRRKPQRYVDDISLS